MIKCHGKHGNQEWVYKEDVSILVVLNRDAIFLGFFLNSGIFLRTGRVRKMEIEKKIENITPLPPKPPPPPLLYFTAVIQVKQSNSKCRV